MQSVSLLESQRESREMLHRLYVGCTAYPCHISKLDPPPWCVKKGIMWVPNSLIWGEFYRFIIIIIRQLWTAFYRRSLYCSSNHNSSRHQDCHPRCKEEVQCQALCKQSKQNSRSCVTMTRSPQLWRQPRRKWPKDPWKTQSSPRKHSSFAQNPMHLSRNCIESICLVFEIDGIKIPCTLQLVQLTNLEFDLASHGLCSVFACTSAQKNLAYSCHLWPSNGYHAVSETNLPNACISRILRGNSFCVIPFKPQVYQGC